MATTCMWPRRKLHFLAGKPLDRLKDGAAVVFLTQLTLTTDNFATSLRRTPERFVFSYDSVGREILSHEAGRRAADHLAPVGHGGGSLVPGQRGHQLYGPAAGSSILVALRTARGRAQGRSRGDGRIGLEPDPPYRDLQPPAARPTAALDRGRRSVAPGRSQETDRPRRANIVNRLRNRLIGIFLAATLVPLAATLWITTSLLDRSLSYASTGELDRLSRSLQRTGKELYQRACDSLKNDALSGRAATSAFRRGRAGAMARAGEELLR